MKVFDRSQIYQNMFLRSVIAFLPLKGDKEGWATRIKVKSVHFFRTGHIDFRIFQAFL